MGHAGRTMAIDVVHKDFFRDYLREHLVPFAQKFSERALRHHEILATGKAFAEGMEAESREGLYDRIRPVKLVPKSKARLRSMIRRW